MGYLSAGGSRRFLSGAGILNQSGDRDREGRLEKMAPGASKLVAECLGVRSGEDLLVLIDRPNWLVGEALSRAGRELGAEVSLAMMESRRAHAENPPRPFQAALSNTDAAVLAAVFSMANSEARRQAVRDGTRLVSLPGCREETLISGAIEADFPKLKPLIEAVGRILSAGTLVEVTSPSGTDLKIRLAGRKSVDQTAIAREPGSWAPAPNIETAVGPDENGVTGRFVVDGVLIPGGVPSQPVEVLMDKGKVVDIAGGEDARKLEAFIDSFGDAAMRQVVEFGIGLNPHSRIGLGLMAEDESKFGTVHLGLGEGRTFGVPITAPSHIDLVIRRPTVRVDGREIVRGERLAEDLEKEFGVAQ